MSVCSQSHKDLLVILKSAVISKIQIYIYIYIYIMSVCSYRLASYFKISSHKQNNIYIHTHNVSVFVKTC